MTCNYEIPSMCEYLSEKKTMLIGQNITQHTQAVSSVSKLPSTWDLILVMPLSIYGERILKTTQSRIYERRLGISTERLLNGVSMGSAENDG